MKKIFLPFFLISVMFLAFPLYAAEKDISVKAEVDKAFLTIGEPVTYTVTVTHSPEIKILTRIPPPDSSILEIKKIEDIDRKNKKEIVTGRRFIMTTYRLGEFVLSPVTINYKTGENGTEKSIRTQKIYLTVKSVSEEGEPKEDIRDVKSVVLLTPRRAWIFWLIGLFAIITIAFLIYRHFVKKPGAIDVPKTFLSPDQEAMARLRELFESDLLSRGFVKLYYLKLSEILRAYLEKRYGILAVESTTYEIMRALRGTELPVNLKEKMNYVLSSADLAKFAKWVPPPSEVIAINKKAEEIVLESKSGETSSQGKEASNGV